MLNLDPNMQSLYFIWNFNKDVHMSDQNFFCIYSGKDLPESERSDEHIVPYALGGSNQFITNDVSTKANNEAGSKIDAALINSWFVASERWRLALKSQKGAIPPITFEGFIDVNGHKVKATYAINPDHSVELITIPEVNCDWENGKIKINCDPKELSEIFDNINRKAKKKGIKLDKEKFIDLAGNAIKIENPEMAAHMAFNVHALAPGFLKMALATGHRVLGKSWSKGINAEMLRKAMWESDLTNLENHHIRGSVWPNCTTTLKPVTDIGKDRHLLMVLNTGPVSFYCLLFGEFEGMIQLQDGIWAGPELGHGDGRVFIIDCKTRQLEELGFGQFIVKRGNGEYST